ncbi:aldose epimerase [Bacillus sp. PS06]|uniref:aldose epimerase family protein n=1 Tax=Bacillus sp. PS06 TaxID=2764176 RepID=UPI0017869EB6|nr:aldose epimerase [Bacillus sp. PS06]MBD8069394.1 aldose epimerase [Bacillus sp. PS06]
MYEVTEAVDRSYKVYILKDKTTNSWVKIAPERGGIVYSYGVEGEELLYLNEETFNQPDANVRGGIPILFPISGQLTDGSYEWDGITYRMNNHGFARNASWEVAGYEQDGKASLTLRLVSNEQTKASYPFEVEVVFTYVLENGRLAIHQEYMNTGEQPMPMYPGFHPYFKSTGKNLTYETDATRYFDYNDGQAKEFEGRVDLEGLKEAVVLLDANQSSIAFQPSSGGKRIRLDYGSEFKYVMLWTESGKDFVCVEPWMAKTDEFNRKDELVMVGVGENVQTVLSIGVL